MSDATDLTSPSVVRESPSVAARTDLREPTDVHRTKISPDDPRLRIDRPRSRTLRKGPALLALGLVTVLGAIALVVAFRSPENPPDSKGTTQAHEVNPSAVPLPDVIKDPSPSADSPSPDGGPVLFPRSSGVQGAPLPTQSEEASAEENSKARGSGLFAQIDEAPSGGSAMPRQVQAPPAPTSPASGAAAPATAQSSEPNRAPDPNMQERKNEFLSKTGSSSAEYLAKTLTAPMSAYEVKAGTVIPTVLITGINSDLPGQAVGQVRENVYDTVSGNHLLIPQGSRLIAAYDSMIAWARSASSSAGIA